jgi:hypothetical protein
MITYRDEDAQIFIYEFVPRFLADMEKLVLTGMSDSEFAQFIFYIKM